MEPGELAVGDAQSRRGDVRDEGLDARPVHDLAGRDPPADATGQQPPQCHARTGVDRHHFPTTVDVGQLDLVRPDQPGALEVDQVSGAQVLGQQDLAGASFESLQAHGVAHELHSTGLEVGDAGDGHEELPSGDADDDAGHGRVRGEAQLGDEVLDTSETVSVPVDERAPDHAGQVQDLDGHPWRSSSDAVREAVV